MKIKRARERLRMTQADLAARIGVSQKTIDNWEHDRRYPKSSIGALEDVLGVSLDDDPVPPPREIPPDVREWITEALPGDPDAQRRVIGLLDGTLTWPGKGQGEAPRRAAG